MPDREELGALFRAARIKAGYESVYQMSQATGISTATIDGIERGNRSPSIETLEMVLDAIGWDVMVVFKPRRKS